MKVLLLGNNSDKADYLIKKNNRFISNKIDYIKLGEISRKKLITKWILKPSYSCGIYTDCIQYQKKRRLILMFLCLANSSNKFVIDSSGKIIQISAFKTFVVNSFSFLIEIMLSLFLWHVFTSFLFFFKRYLKSNPKRKLNISNRKKLIFLRTNYWFDLKFGGSVSHIKGITDGLQSLGYTVEFLSTDKLENIDTKVTIIQPVTFFTNSQKLAKLFYNFIILFKGIKYIRDSNPKFIYHRHDALIFANILLARILKTPLILEFNSSEVWKKKYWGGHKSLWFYKICEEISVVGADHIITVSEANKHNLCELYNIPEEKITVNFNGVDPDIFKPNNQLRDEIRNRYNIQKNIVVGFIGSFGVWHGVEVLASIMNDVLHSNPNIHFLWVGDGPYMKYVEENTIKYNLQKKVNVVGSVPHSRIPGYLNACDILVSPHTPQVDGAEFFGSPTKLFEYMAVGKGIVASNLGQIGSVLEHMKDAILVKPGNKEELIKGILKLSEDSSLRDYFGINAQDKALHLYSWKTNSKRVINVVNKLA